MCLRHASRANAAANIQLPTINLNSLLKYLRMAFRFLRFKVFQDAKFFHRKIVFLTKDFPVEFYYLKDQIRRSSLSIVLSIAEGSAKTSDKDFNRYIEIAMGSGNETAAGLDVSLQEGLILQVEYDEAIKICENVVNQLGGFSKKLRVGN